MQNTSINSLVPPLLYVLQGIPGGGKSTIAKQILEINAPALRINRDDLRAMTGAVRPPESLIIESERKLARLWLSLGITVVVDDTNLTARSHASWSELAKQAGAALRFIDVHAANSERGRLGNSIEQARLVNSERETPVPEDAMDNFQALYQDYRVFLTPHPNLTHLTGPLRLPRPRAIICDLDGTLLYSDGKRNMYDPGDACLTDTWNYGLLDIMAALRLDSSIGKIIFLTGRTLSKATEAATLQKLHEKFYSRHFGSVDDRTSTFSLLGRGPADTRADWLVKKDFFLSLIAPQYHVAYVFDDRPQVCRMWQQLGLPLYQLGFGREF